MAAKITSRSSLVEHITSLRPSERISRLGFSDIVKIRNRVLDLKRGGMSVLQLEGGEPYAPTPEFIKDAMKRALDENQTRYAPSSGIPPLLDAIRLKLREKNGIDSGDDGVIVIAGGMHGLFCSFETILNHGDETIFFSPYWTPIKDLVCVCGGNPVLIPWQEIRDGDVTASIERRLTERTRAIYLNSPANPTGDVLTRGQLEAIAKLAIERDLLVISDEAYEDLVYEGEAISIASLPEMFSRTISVYTLSKTYSMTGWRIGYIAAQPLWMDALKRIVLNSVNGVSTPTQYAAAAAIGDRSSHLATMREEYRKRRDLLVSGLNSNGFPCVGPAGAFYLFVDVRERLGTDSWAAMNTLLERTGIATVPGVVFGPHGEGFLRMSFSNPIDILEKAVEALGRLR